MPVSMSRCTARPFSTMKMLDPGSTVREGEVSLERIASALHTSPRTLHRRLEALDLGFRELRDDTRRRLAEQHLADRGMGIAEVALMLGYSEQSAFTRAFKRWTGVTPSASRRKP